MFPIDAEAHVDALDAAGLLADGEAHDDLDRWALEQAEQWRDGLVGAQRKLDAIRALCDDTDCGYWPVGAGIVPTIRKVLDGSVRPSETTETER